MKKIKKSFALVFVMMLSFASHSQLVLTGPTSLSLCDVSGIEYNAFALGYVDDKFDDIDWRYKFKLWSAGSVKAEYTNNGIANWDIDYNDFAFVSGPYQVSCDVQYKWGPFWLTDETLWSNGINLNLFGTQGEYDADKVSYRMVSGDFDRDGYEDDMAAFYHYGGSTSALHVWESDGNDYTYQGDNGWWSGTSYNSTKTTGRVVSGDFDRDGFKDDIAAFYDYGNNHTRVHVWTSTGSSMNYAGQWWITGSGSSGYDANKITGRIVVGDFDRDGFEDDICMFYDYGNFTTQAHILKSTGSSFTYGGTWYNSGAGNFLASAVSYKMVSGDFDRDGFKDDITGFYQYSGALTKAFVWRSTGSSFSWPQTWYNSGSGNFDASKITGRVVSGDFDHDGYEDDITACYSFSGALTKGFVWRSTGSSYLSPATWYNSGSGNFNASLISGKVVSGDFDHDGYNGDVSVLYDYGGFSTRVFTLESTTSSFSWPATTWEICNPGGRMAGEESPLTVNVAEDSKELLAYPNPTSGEFTVLAKNTEFTKIEVVSIDGTVVHSFEHSSFTKLSVNLSGQAKGVYLIKAYDDQDVLIERVIVQ